MQNDVRVRLDPESVDLFGVLFTPWTEQQVVAHVMNSLAASETRRGGWIVTPNVDILRKIVTQPGVRKMIESATLAVPDGMPLVWASALQRTPFPERVTGASLLGSLCASAVEHDRSVYLLGGEPGVANEAARRLGHRHRGLQVSGWTPPFGEEATPEGMAKIRARLQESAPDLVFCGFGFPKQERVIYELGRDFPHVWFVGCGASLTFASGRIGRAPKWMQRVGLEWLHRLCREPKRMFRRYIIHDLPFAVRLLGGSLMRGLITAGPSSVPAPDNVRPMPAMRIPATPGGVVTGPLSPASSGLGEFG